MPLRKTLWILLRNKVKTGHGLKLKPHWQPIHVLVKKAKVELTEQEANFSDREQSGVKQDEYTQRALFEGNVAYEQKFGFIFLIKAAGLSSEQILCALQQRLQHDLETEKKIVHEQLAAIALLRLSQGIQA